MTGKGVLATAVLPIAAALATAVAVATGRHLRLLHEIFSSLHTGRLRILHTRFRGIRRRLLAHRVVLRSIGS